MRPDPACSSCGATIGPDTDVVAPRDLLRMPEVEALACLTESSIYRRIKAGKFPSPIKLNSRAVAWREREVMAWVESRIWPEGHPCRVLGPTESIIPEGEPSADMVRSLLAKSGHTAASAAEALGLSRRTLERYSTNGPRWKRPKPYFLAALNVLAPPRRTSPISRLLRLRKRPRTA